MTAPSPKQPLRFKRLSLLLLLATLAGCGKQGGMQPPPPPMVNVITVQPKSVPITTELPGRIDPLRIAQVNARVDGVVLHQEFEQGSTVTNGQVLYQIDPAPYQATLDSAKANSAQAEALVKRYEPLVSINAVSKQNYDNATAAAAQAKAAEEIAAINLGYCAVTAPITGTIGAALVTEGALVSQSAATPMAVIQTLDPVYFDFTESSADVLKLRKQIAAGQLENVSSGEPKVTLQLSDGSAYPHEGKLLFRDITVDPGSGMVTLRAEFPNPEGLLLPGMFAVGRLEQAISPQTILVPQQSVVIGPDGSATVNVITSSNSVALQPIQLGPTVGADWVVESGLNAGDRVMVAGLQKAFPGMTVTPVPVDNDTNTPSAAPAAQPAQ